MKRLTSLQQSLRAVLGLLVITLQVLGALHFTLVRHGYSAALGGVVHVHPSARVEQESASKAASSRSAALVADSPGCAAELCPDGNAPRSFAPKFELLVTGSVAFGEALLLSERPARSSESLRLFLSAPKTSPPA